MIPCTSSSLRILFLCVCAASIAAAQPSGGPYGPVQKTYALPSGPGTILYVAPDGSAGSAGTTLASPTTIEHAVELAKTGDAIVMRGGIYRTGNLVVNQGITIQPYADEKPVMKGTRVAAAWKNLGNGVWSTTWATLFPSKPDSWWQRDSEGKKTPQYKFNNDMVFIDGRFMQMVGWEGELTENTYCIDYETGTVYIGADPTNRTVEITAFNIGILRTTKNAHGRASDRKGYTLRGITLTQYAYRALEIEGTEPTQKEDESKHGKEVVGTTIEDCEISFCSRVAGYFKGDHLTIRNCRISDTSTEGVYVIGSADVLLEKNIFMRNNIENITGYYPSAVKIFNQTNRVTCNDNLVTDLPNSNGIWYDVGNADGVFTNNWIENVGRIGSTIPTHQLWPSDNGFFFEISNGCICAGNVFVNCDHGMLVLNSANVQVCQNTFVNSMACFGRNGREPSIDHFGWHSSTAPGVTEREGHSFFNNLLVGGSSFVRPLMFVWQPAQMCDRTPNAMLKDLDYNQFIRGVEKPAYPVMLWSPAKNAECQTAFDRLDSLAHAYPQFAAHGRMQSAGFIAPLFTSVELGHFELQRPFSEEAAGRTLAPEIAKLLSKKLVKAGCVGAFPPAH